MWALEPLKLSGSTDTSVALADIPKRECAGGWAPLLIARLPAFDPTSHNQVEGCVLATSRSGALLRHRLGVVPLPSPHAQFDGAANQ
jgi:hypothetical protein